MVSVFGNQWAFGNNQGMSLVSVYICARRRWLAFACWSLSDARVSVRAQESGPRAGSGLTVPSAHSPLWGAGE